MSDMNTHGDRTFTVIVDDKGPSSTHRTFLTDTNCSARHQEMNSFDAGRMLRTMGVIVQNGDEVQVTVRVKTRLVPQRVEL